MKKFLGKFFSFLCVFCLGIFSIGTYASDYLIYNPKEIMLNGNTTIEGGRQAFNSRDVQNYLFKSQYPSNEEKVVFLTFDDGPSLDNTPKVLDILRENGVKATFFLLGSNLENGGKYEEILKRTIQEGHAIANHGYSHDYSFLYPGRNINYTNLKRDIDRSHEIMKKILGDEFETKVLRLPGGLRSWKGQDDTLDKLNQEGYSVIEWNALSGDSEGRVKNSEDLVNKAINTSKGLNFVVLLMHDFAGKAGAYSVGALPEIIKYFKDNGYVFRTMY